MKINSDKIIKIKWSKDWSGYWCLITCTNFGFKRFKAVNKNTNIKPKAGMIITKRGYSVGFFGKKDLELVGKKIATKIEKNPRLATNWAKILKDTTDNINEKLLKFKNCLPSAKEFAVFNQDYIKFAAFNYLIKQVADHLPTKHKEKIIKEFAEVRLYSENIYTDCEKFIDKLARLVGKKIKYPSRLIKCFTMVEFEKYLAKGIFPQLSVLKERDKLSVFYFDNRSEYLIIGKDAIMINRTVNSSVGKVISGITAYPGKVRGTARIIMNPQKVKIFNSGNILIAGMTRPDYLFLMKKSAAIVTDAGGLLCHAAITAREIKKPCIIGTEVGSSVIKDGDLVEVDATKGIIKILNTN